jgi:hypothetical protein
MGFAAKPGGFVRRVSATFFEPLALVVPDLAGN